MMRACAAGGAAGAFGAAGSRQRSGTAPPARAVASVGRKGRATPERSAPARPSGIDSIGLRLELRLTPNLVSVQIQGEIAPRFAAEAGPFPFPSVTTRPGNQAARGRGMPLASG